MVSWLPTLGSFLCCYGVEAGAKIIAVLHMVASLLLVVVCGYYTSCFKELSMSGDPEGVYHKWYVVALVATLLNVGHLVLSLILLYGIRKRRSCAVRVWVWVMVSLSAGCFLLGLGLAFSSAGNVAYTIMTQLAFFLPLLYCVTVVNSYFMMLKSIEDMEGPKSDF